MYPLNMMFHCSFNFIHIININVIYNVALFKFDTGHSSMFFNIYSFTNNSRPDRLREIADRFNLDQNAMLDNVLYCRAYTSKKN